MAEDWLEADASENNKSRILWERTTGATWRTEGGGSLIRNEYGDTVVAASKEGEFSDDMSWIVHAHNKPAHRRYERAVAEIDRLRKWVDTLEKKGLASEQQAIVAQRAFEVQAGGSMEGGVAVAGDRMTKIVKVGPGGAEHSCRKAAGPGWAYESYQMGHQTVDYPTTEDWCVATYVRRRDAGAVGSPPNPTAEASLTIDADLLNVILGAIPRGARYVSHKLVVEYKA